jgi:hypothetical protein
VNRPVIRAVFLFAAFTLSINGMLWAQAAKVAPGTKVVLFRVRVYNYESVPDGTLSVAQNVAGGVLQPVGLQAMWQDCTLDNPKWDSVGCNMHPVRIDLVLYLVARLEDHAPYAERSALGYSIIPDNGARATLAYVCYARVKKVLSAFSAGELLGLAIAHEIGHLLLGKNSHSNAGLMRPRWPSRDLEAKRWEEFTFTSKQVRRLRAAILARMTSEEPLPAIPAPLR